MRRNLSNILWGLLFIFVGVGLIGNIFDLWDYKIFFTGWWTLFLIIPAFVSMVQTGIKIGNSIVMGIGILLLLDQQNVIKDGLVYQFAAPAVLIIIGLAILSKAIIKKPVKTNSVFTGKAVTSSEDFPSYLAVFSGNTVKNNSINFQGGNATAIFGGNEIDLSDVILSKDVEFNVTTIFAGTEIIAPKNARVELHGFPIFGGNENTAISSADPQAFKIVFQCTSIFGGSEIK